jgi:hypothetical protein
MQKMKLIKDKMRAHNNKKMISTWMICGLLNNLFKKTNKMSSCKEMGLRIKIKNLGHEMVSKKYMMMDRGKR